MTTKFQVKIFNTKNMTAAESEPMTADKAWEIYYKAEEKGLTAEMWREGEKMTFLKSEKQMNRVIA